MPRPEDQIRNAREAFAARLIAAGFSNRSNQPSDPPIRQTAAVAGSAALPEPELTESLEQMPAELPQTKWKEEENAPDSPLSEPEPFSASSPEPAPAASAKASASGRIRKRSKAALESDASVATSSSRIKREPSPSAAAANPTIGTSTSERRPPDWYEELSKKPNTQRAAAGSRPLESRLRRVRDFIRECKSARRVAADQFDKVRVELHELEFIKVTPYALNKARLLHNRDGLPQIFDSNLSDGVDFPWDIKSDAEELYNKWCQKMFDPDLYRGIKVGGKGKAKVQSLVEAYPDRVDCNYWGAGLLINGQWWPNQLCCLRDGAHGSAQGGIHGKKGHGAYSIVLSGGHYQDRDEAAEIWYCGTDSADGIITDATQRMIESSGSGRPVRVLRSQALPATNRWKPVRGYRYDGLYDVLDYHCVDRPKQIHLFHLRRREGQDPIRCTGVEARPTPQEIAAIDDLREKYGYAA